MLASPGRPCGFPKRALMRGIVSRGQMVAPRTLLFELRALQACSLHDNIWCWGAIFYVAVAERSKDDARRRAGQASNKSTTI